MEDLKQIQEFFSKPLEEGKQLDQVDFAKVVKAVEQTGHPVTVLLTPKFNEIEVLTGMNAPDDMLFDLSNAVDSLGYGRNDIIIASDSSNLSRREYSDIRKVNGGAKDYFEESVSEADLNDPVAMKMRAAKMKADKLAKLRAANAGDDGNDKFFEKSTARLRKLKALKDKRAQIMSDMEQEAEIEGGAAADKYGDMLNKLDKAISMLGEAVNEYDVYMPSQEEVDQFFEKETHLQTHYLNSKPVMGQEGSFNKTEIAPWDEYDYSNWKALVSKALEEYNAGIYYNPTKDDTADKAKEAGDSALKKVKDMIQKVLKEEEGYSKYLKTDDNPEGKTKGLDTKTMNKILMNVIKDLDELKQLGEGVIEEELCPKGKAYIKKRQAAGEKSSAYLSGRAVKVCKGQMKG